MNVTPPSPSDHSSVFEESHEPPPVVAYVQPSRFSNFVSSSAFLSALFTTFTEEYVTLVEYVPTPTLPVYLLAGSGV